MTMTIMMIAMMIGKHNNNDKGDDDASVLHRR